MTQSNCLPLASKQMTLDQPQECQTSTQL